MVSTTKFYIPTTRASLVARPRLLRQIDAGLRLGHRLSLIAAPAGYGKTTLAAAWLAKISIGDQASAPVSWLSLDDADNDPLRFFAYAMAALRRPGLDIGQHGQEMLKKSQPPITELGLALIEDLSGLDNASSSPILVLDDYHRIQSSYIHETIQFLLEHLPFPLHIVLLTREDPPLPLARWRVQNAMTEIRASDLRFTVEEAGDFLNRVMALDLPADSVALLETRTEGWIAGLQLAALSLQDHADPAQFVQMFAGDDRQVVDYLADEVLARQPASLQRFLLHTSILDRMCGELCDALLGESENAAVQIDAASPAAGMTSGQHVLQWLERRNLFVVPLDNRRRWYRYHHLFGDLLRHHLQVMADPATVAGLHRRAARWYADHGYPAEAVAHALSTEDVDLAADLIEQALASGATWSGGEVGLWQAWWRALPARVLRARPRLSLRISRALYLAGHIDQVDHLLDEVEEALRETPDVVGDGDELLAQAGVYRAAVAAMRGEIRRAIEETHRALARLPGRETLVRARAYDTLGMAYELRGDLAEANWAYLEASALAQNAGVFYLVINARCEAAMVQIAQGQLRQALQTCRAAMDLAAPDEAAKPPLGLAWSVIGDILREQNELAQAEDALLRGMEYSQQGEITDDLRFEYLFLATLRLAQGDHVRALSALQQVELLLQGYHVPRLTQLAAAHRARIWLAQGQRELAARWADAYAGMPQREYLREFEDLTLARVWLAGAQTKEATALLNRLLAAAEAGGRMGRVIECLALLALARQAQDDPSGALDALARALTLAEPEGYARLFLDEGRPMLNLIYRTSSQGIAPAYAGRLLAMAAAETNVAKPPASPSPIQPDATLQPLVEPLTERELEVLALLAERLTNQEIAQRLVISLPTVKSHTANIYAKLGVSSRTEAAAQARSLGILTV